ncbi:casein kinase 1-like protein 2 [Hyalella azteca]|uniref:Casein kinase 1-like protein 2 n=1 Tax=Hyalella azteca TaxID=294128 RepID=A0A979FV83_HYAAZ|nr:casein kinase 1-like protein 2 [Hyalella azteca]
MATNVHRIRPGDRIGNYLVLDVIGEGSYGRVFHVQDKRSHEEFALKFETKNRSLLQHESQVINEIHRIAPGGFAPEIPAAKIVHIENVLRKIFIVDFGLSRKYLDKNGQHVPLLYRQGTRGTLAYMSINTQQGISMSRRDDIESLSYVAIFLAKGSLPWSQVNLQDKAKMYQDALFLKKRVNQYELCRELPPVFLEFLKYARQMKFAQQSEYTP